MTAQMKLVPEYKDLTETHLDFETEADESEDEKTKLITKIIYLRNVKQMRDDKRLKK